MHNSKDWILWSHCSFATDFPCVKWNKTRNVWQCLACSPPGIAVSPSGVERLKGQLTARSHVKPLPACHEISVTVGSLPVWAWQTVAFIGCRDTRRSDQSIQGMRCVWSDLPGARLQTKLWRPCDACRPKNHTRSLIRGVKTRLRLGLVGLRSLG